MPSLAGKPFSGSLIRTGHDFCVFPAAGACLVAAILRPVPCVIAYDSAKVWAARIPVIVSAQVSSVVDDMRERQKLNDRNRQSFYMKTSKTNLTAPDQYNYEKSNLTMVRTALPSRAARFCPAGIRGVCGHQRAGAIHVHNVGRPGGSSRRPSMALTESPANWSLGQYYDVNNYQNGFIYNRAASALIPRWTIHPKMAGARLWVFQEI